jgi:hypothetical protein
LRISAGTMKAIVRAVIFPWREHNWGTMSCARRRNGISARAALY